MKLGKSFLSRIYIGLESSIFVRQDFVLGNRIGEFLVRGRMLFVEFRVLGFPLSLSIAVAA